MIDNFLDAVAGEELAVIDAHDTPTPLLTSATSLYIGKTALRSHAEAAKHPLLDLMENGTRRSTASCSNDGFPEE